LEKLGNVLEDFVSEGFMQGFVVAFGVGEEVLMGGGEVLIEAEGSLAVADGVFFGNEEEEGFVGEAGKVLPEVDLGTLDSGKPPGRSDLEDEGVSSVSVGFGGVMGEVRRPQTRRQAQSGKKLGSDLG
jgi:hypothetical protein